ncbi:hypothetical protein PAPYR_4104 [Paratrimastix pyriformis]|uniref:Uncharacterized protein n=1 Tax=Paratrimastix pyriformis TaxID=342808 RepID=A0ABQ8UKH1_9EUKA|nr:hypothetical protein PAPYR_4104 [Paratrimastix pyriformis]
MAQPSTQAAIPPLPLSARALGNASLEGPFSSACSDRPATSGGMGFALPPVSASRPPGLPPHIPRPTRSRQEARPPRPQQPAGSASPPALAFSLTPRMGESPLGVADAWRPATSEGSSRSAGPRSFSASMAGAPPADGQPEGWPPPSARGSRNEGDSQMGTPRSPRRQPVDENLAKILDSSRAYLRQSQRLTLARRSLDLEREQARALLEMQKMRTHQQWRRKLERSPFLVNLVAQTQRQEEELRLRQLEEERRAQLVQSRKSKVKQEIILRALAEREPLEDHKQRRAELESERQLRIQKAIEAEQRHSPRSPRSPRSPHHLPLPVALYAYAAESEGTAPAIFPSIDGAGLEDGGLEDVEGLAGPDGEEDAPAAARPPPPDQLTLQEELRQQRLALSEAALAKRREELISRVAATPPLPPPSRGSRRGEAEGWTAPRR